VTPSSDAYFIGATPRTGSSLLCGLLASTGVAGRPESYFRAADIGTWATAWGVADERGDVDFGEFVRRARLVGATDNGVFACRVMWGTLEEVIDRLRATSSCDRDDLDILRRTFGEVRFVYLFREDVLAQAVSWARAEQTDVWHASIGGGRVHARAAPSYDRAQIDALISTIAAHNQAWRDWFASVGVRPQVVRYETLQQDPIATASAVVAALGLELDPLTPIEVRHRRLRDQITDDWIARYRAGAGQGSEDHVVWRGRRS
jgi:LPS sulfotransferase NodH